MANAQNGVHDALLSTLQESMQQVVIGCLSKEITAQVWTSRKRTAEEILGGKTL